MRKFRRNFIRHHNSFIGTGTAILFVCSLNESKTDETSLYAADRNYHLNVHYCSLENKHFGQIYMQNTASPLTDRTYVMSEKDFYLKTVKAFGTDAEQVEQILKKNHCKDYRMNRELHFIQLSPSCASLFRDAELELAISYNVCENRSGKAFIRELRLDYVYSDKYNIEDL